MVEIRWLNSALESLHEILAYNTIDNPHYAEILEDRIIEFIKKKILLS